MNRQYRTCSPSARGRPHEAISPDHNDVGGEHLLLGLAAEPHCVGGAALRDAGAEPRGLPRGTRTSARSKQPATPWPCRPAVADAVRQQLAPVIERLDAVEECLARVR
jgi:hypothetical protein